MGSGLLHAGRVERRVLVKVDAGLVKLVRQRISSYGHLVGFGEVIDGNRRTRAGGGGIVGDGGEDAGRHVERVALLTKWPIDGDDGRVPVVARGAGADGAEGIVVVVLGVALVLVLVLVAGEERAAAGRLPRLVRGHGGGVIRMV